MGTREEGSRQHPDYPPGWTYDHVHREKYGRIQLHSPSEIEERKLVQRFTGLVVTSPISSTRTHPPQLILTGSAICGAASRLSFRYAS